MEVLSKNDGLLTNIEIMSLLQGRDSQTRDSPAFMNRNRIEADSMKFLSNSVINGTTVDMATECFEALAKLKLGLTPAELLQVSNHIPMTECEIHMIIEDAHERLIPEQFNSILTAVKECYNIADEEEEKES